jgi:Fur family transcriptional regulator, ferric uptake regulator
MTDEFQTYLTSKGLKNTKQRALIVDIFLSTKDHINVDSLYQKVKAKNPGIGYATVYRTMKLLKESGVASERHFGTGQALYEPLLADEHHDHLICISCRKIIEFENPKIESLQERVAKDHQFKLTTHKHELYGHCKKCQ